MIDILKDDFLSWGIQKFIEKTLFKKYGVKADVSVNRVQLKKANGKLKLSLDVAVDADEELAKVVTLDLIDRS